VARLVLKLDNVLLREYNIADRPITIGRLPDNTIPLDNLAVSGHHARVVEEQGQFVLYDENSTNGTYVNGQKVARAALVNGDSVHVGRHVLTFVDEEPMEAMQAPAIGLLHVLSGKTDRPDYVLDRDQTVIGKNDSANVKLQRWFAPKVAAIIERRQGKYFLVAEAAPVSVNSELVHQERELTAGDTISVDEVTLAFTFKS
jgi:predicted component of type VI protein secretion system